MNTRDCPRSAFGKEIDLWSAQYGSPAATSSRLTSTHCAPPEIVFFPNCPQINVTPTGAARPISFRPDREWATLLNNHLTKMRAGGQKPFFDFYHEPKNGKSGFPYEFFWLDNRGVVALVEWTPQGEQMILEGTCTGFSPTWVHLRGGFPLGLMPDCGALLHHSMKPALRFMPPVKPVTKAAAMKLQVKRFVERVVARLPDFSGDEYPTAKAGEVVAREYPALHAAYQLDQALQREFAADGEVYS